MESSKNIKTNNTDYIQLTLNFAPKERDTRLLSVTELFDSMNQSLFTTLKEDIRVEFKQVNVNQASLGDYFSMWSNTKPDGGILIIGLENDGSASGCIRANQKHINDIERARDIHCPEAAYDVKRIIIENDHGEEDFVIVFRIYYRNNKVVRTVRQEAFIRSGDTKRKLTQDEIHQLEIERGQVKYEQEPCGLNYPKDFDMNLISQYVLSYQEKRAIKPDTHTTEDILNLSHLGIIENNRFIPNNACALLFANDPRICFPGCKIRFQRFEGDTERTGDKYNATKDIFIDEGSVPKQIVACEKVMDLHVREFSRLGKDGLFYSAPEYPKDAWYEAIVNACVHRSYANKNMNIFVKMFNDRLVVESPGGFPPSVTSDNIYDMHVPTNPFLMEAMYYLNFVKCAHEGTRRIRDTMVGLGLPRPEFIQKEVTSSLVQVTLRNNIVIRKLFIDKDASTIIGEAVASTLTEYEKRIINFLAENKQISVSQTQRLTGKSWPASSKLLKGLKNRGILDDIRKSNKIDRDPSARYVLRTSPYTPEI